MMNPTITAPTRDANGPLYQKALDDIRRTALSRIGSRAGKLDKILAICAAVEESIAFADLRAGADTLAATPGIVSARQTAEADLIADDFNPDFDL